MLYHYVGYWDWLRGCCKSYLTTAGCALPLAAGVLGDWLGGTAASDVMSALLRVYDNDCCSHVGIAAPEESRFAAN